MSLDIRPNPSASAGGVTGGLEYKGSYNATTNSPDLTSSEKGDFYIVSVGGTLAGITLDVGDHIVFNQDASSPITSAMFDKIDNTDAVASVNGQTGVVSLGASDVSALAIASNLSDLNNVGTARTNLGLGTAAVLNTGTSNGNVVLLDATGLPAVDGSQLTGVTSTDTTKLAIASNLSDLNNVGTARTNLGLGSAATLTAGTGANNAVQLDGSSRLPAVDGSQLTNVTGTDATKLAIASNLSDLNNVGTARTNLGLGTAAVLNTGTSNGNVVLLDATGLPAVDGSQLTGVTGTDATKLAIASNLSDLNNAGTARTNLGLGTAAVLDTGTSNGDIVLLDATGLPAVDGSQLTGVTGTDATKLAIANNLSDLNNAGTARTNLGLGTAAVLTAGTGANNAVQLDGSSRLPAVDGSQLTGVTGTDATKLAITNNLSDLNNAGTARTNLGLGTAAVLNTGTANGDIVLLDATGLPAVDGSQLTGVTSTDATKLAIANNLSDLNNAGTARTNLGLGSAAVLVAGTAANNAVQLDGSSRLPAVDGSQLTGVTSTDATKLAIANNLSDLNNVGTARTNLGLGSAAVLVAGTAANNAVQLDGSSRLPAVDGSQLTGVTSTDATKLAIANNLSDLNNAGTARTNLGLGSAAVLVAGTAANNAVQLDGSSRLPAVDGSQLTNLPSSGGFSYTAITSASSPVTSSTGVHYGADSSGGSIVFNLPALSGLTGGEEIRVKLNTAGNNLTLTPNGSDTIEGASTYVMSITKEAVTCVASSGTNWEII